MKKGKLFVISGPSGVGKGTIVNRILAETDIQFSVSMTTRAPREGEVDGKSYFFVTQEEFANVIDNDGFLEHAEVYGNRYGTPKKQTEERLSAGIDVLLDIDIQGALNVKRLSPDAVFIFILPPSLDELRSRIMNRGTETEESLKIRIGSVMSELKHVRDYDYCIINDDLEKAVSTIKAIFTAEHAKFSEDIFDNINLEREG